MIYSQAPWQYAIDRFVYAADGTVVCDPHCDGGADEPLELEGNGFLLAAAPDLFQVCLIAENWLSEHATGPDTPLKGVLIELRRVIAKAQGPSAEEQQ